MPILNCYVDDATFQILKQQAELRERGETAATLAEAAISEAACRADRARQSLPPQNGDDLNAPRTT